MYIISNGIEHLTLDNMVDYLYTCSEEASSLCVEDRIRIRNLGTALWDSIIDSTVSYSCVSHTVEEYNNIARPNGLATVLLVV